MQSLDPSARSLSRRGFLRSTAVCTVGLATAGLVAGCGGEKKAAGSGALPTTGPRLTDAQAEALAVSRFGNYRAQRVPVTWTNPGGMPDGGTAVVDFVNHLGWGVTGGDKTPMAWTDERVAAPAQQPYDSAETWAGRELLPSENQFDVLLLVMLSLGSDRPENPQLLVQTDAMYLGSRNVGTDDCWVFKGPSQQVAATASASPSPSVTASGDSRTRYWVRKSDKRMVRFEANLGDAQGRFARIELAVDDPTPASMPEYMAPALNLRVETAADRKKQQQLLKQQQQKNKD